MPVVKVFCSKLPGDEACELLAVDLHALCLNEMGAQPDAIQVLLIPGVVMLLGEPVLVEVHYRDRPDRKGPALDRFLAGVDQAVTRAFSSAPRIRSFAIDQSTLGAVR